MITRARHGIVKPKDFSDYVMKADAEVLDYDLCLVAAEEPDSVDAALSEDC